MPTRRIASAASHVSAATSLFRLPGKVTKTSLTRTDQMCVDGAGHDQTCKPEKGCIFSRYANRTFFDQQCAAAFGVTAAQTDAAVSFNSANYGDNDPGGSRIVFVNGDIGATALASVPTLQVHKGLAALICCGCACRPFPLRRRDQEQQRAPRARYHGVNGGRRLALRGHGAAQPGAGLGIHGVGQEVQGRGHRALALRVAAGCDAAL